MGASTWCRSPSELTVTQTIDRDEQVILVRVRGQVMAFNQSCPHENSALRWRTDLNRFYCGKHESHDSLSGVFITGGATRNMDRLGITRTGNEVVVDLTRMYKSDVNPGEWVAAVVKVG